jgi:hypothetical protein
LPSGGEVKESLDNITIRLCPLLWSSIEIKYNEFEVRGAYIMQITVKCPACGTDSSFFLAKTDFVGPFRCWKCSELFTMKIRSSAVQSLEPLTKENFDKAKADKAARRKKAKEKT